MNTILDNFRNDYKKTEATDFTLIEYLELCKEDPAAYASAAERMLLAIGEPEYVDTSEDSVLSRIFMNRTIKTYPTFKEFFGMESTIEQIVGFFKHSAQGLEEKKQILYLLGPVGGGKSSLAEKLKALMEKEPFYALKYKGEVSPVFESPLGLFDPETYAEQLKTNYGIPRRYLTGLMSPWAVKRLTQDANGSLEDFSVVKLYPNKLQQIGIAKTEPGDENNQDISALVGKVDIRQLNEFSQNDPDCYSFSGSLNRTTQGMMEFVEMFKAPIKILHPLLTATQEANYNGTEAIGAIPYNGIILAHSNESEWELFRNNKSNEAFLDRVSLVRVPYSRRVQEEIRIYEKLLSSSSLANAPCTPKTLEMLAQFSILSRLVDPENSNIFSKMRIYDGENIKASDPKAKSLQEYADTAGVSEGMSGVSPRFAFKILAKVFNYDVMEIGANPVHLLRVIEDSVVKEQYPKDVEEKYIGYLNEFIKGKYADFIGKEIQIAYIESYSEYGQNLFDRYVEYADHWIQDRDYRDPNSGEMFDREALESELEKIEKPAGVVNVKDFRNEVVNFAIRAKANNQGQAVKWTSYEKLREVIEKKMFASTEDILPVISFNTKTSAQDQEKHNDFVERMGKKGYSKHQVRILVDWYMRVRKAS